MKKVLHSRTLFLKGVLACVFLFALLQISVGMISVSTVQATSLGEINMFSGIGTAGVKSDPREIVKNIINVVMGFLGMLAVLVILYAGFTWMMAAGEKERIERAHKLLINGIIGLAIIFSAWTIAQFVIYALKISVKE